MSCSTSPLPETPRAGGARATGAADAGGLALAGARHQLRLAVAAPAQSRRDHAGHASVPGLRRQPPAGVSPRNRALLRKHPARGSERARSAARELHVRQRAAGEALRHPACLWQPLPAHYARRGQLARRTASPGKHPDGHVVCDEDLAGPARQVGPRQSSWRPSPASAARRAGAEGQHGGRQPLGPQAAGRAPDATRPAPRVTT